MELIKLGVYVERGYLVSDGGLQYLQDALNKKEYNVIINLVGYRDELNKMCDEVMTLIEVETDYGCIPNVIDVVVKVFNRRKRWIKNK